ncbi:hypothetical protein E2562_019953 [Oryza meyeriana var. granulata]|uniref:Uncharacterized protein n=1 Tax=Oryza meyeriana var. granulata TaxID=110450 RepID=A0A6G1CHC3_9ORYZ|nr:hypothetical protein E2562_019953 [Oryza meyeriana var. granulata]
MRHYHRRTWAGVELNDLGEETLEQYALAFGWVMEALEKMLASLEEKSCAEARFTMAAAAKYIFACFVSHDPNFHLEPMEEGIQVASEATNAVHELVRVAADLEISNSLPLAMLVAARSADPS